MEKNRQESWIATFPSQFDALANALPRSGARERPGRQFRHPREWTWPELLSDVLRATLARWRR
ncbi:MAG: hypothetical protein KGL78_13170 [Burkholderiales bacterium]|nr:hypothetical protein [Burkholderiales bacterium]